MKSKLDFYSRLLHVTGDLTLAYRWYHSVTTYNTTMGYSKKECSHIYTMILQFLSKGFCELFEIRQLCEFFPQSCIKIVAIISNCKDEKFTHFMEMLLDDLEIINDRI